MRSVTSLLIATVSCFAACADAPSESTDTESTATQEVLTANKVSANKVSANKVSANKVSANKLASLRLSNHRLTVNLNSAGPMLATADGREVFAFLVSCALPADITLEATVGGTKFEFFGELGLASDWLNRPLNDEGKGWVSACLFARVSAHDVVVPISLRGPRAQLATNADERDAWSVEEGAFFGNYFVPVNQPIEWYACRGEGQASGEFGGLIDRDCAEPDPANPGKTLCGFTYAGDCGAFTSSDAACEDFSDNGQYYRRCHTAPIDDERHHHGHAHHRHGQCEHDAVYKQVVTTYVIP